MINYVKLDAGNLSGGREGSDGKRCTAQAKLSSGIWDRSAMLISSPEPLNNGFETPCVCTTYMRATSIIVRQRKIQHVELELEP